MGARPRLAHHLVTSIEVKAAPSFKKGGIRGLPGGSVVKNLPASAGDVGSIPGLGRSHLLQSN